jgi:hypothetical protein
MDDDPKGKPPLPTTTEADDYNATDDFARSIEEVR